MAAQMDRPSKQDKPKAHARVRRGSTTKSARASATALPANDQAARASAAYQEGNAKLFSGETTTAIKAYQESIHLNPKYPAGYRGLGLAYSQAGKKTEAVRALSRYLKLAPKAKDRGIITERIRLLKSH